MTDLPQPTPYSDVNLALQGFASFLRAILGDKIVGMYLTGSLALGDFDHDSSDIDFIVLTKAPISDEELDEIRKLHTLFDNIGSAWTGRVEANYITPAALVSRPISAESYPQVEKETPLFVAPLESGWIFHLYTLREHELAVFGPSIRDMIDPIDPDDMRRAAAPVAETWLDQSQNDPTWMPWVSERKYQAFVVLTLCRLLYTLETGGVASKPGAARWVSASLDPRRTELVERALLDQHAEGQASPGAVAATMEMLRYAAEKFRNWREHTEAAN